MSNYNQLKDVLNDIFELNKADLDFGIYRIMNQKRKQVNEFIEKHLPEDIKLALSETQSTDKTEIENELKTLKKNLDDAGIVAEESPKYNTLKERLQSVQNTDVLEQEVFSHLANFFKRYYKNGDFISMRRYKKDVYAIPYEGEEVKLHWANHDQYYIKSSENFKNYCFKTPDGRMVNFQLKEVSTEQNNNKTQGDAERRFAIYKELPIEEIDSVLNINFVYEPFSKATKQESLLSEALELLTENVPSTFTSVFTLSPTEKNSKRTLLEKHLNDYVSKNSFDYFIHKDLGGFLSRELDFYIKNEVLYLDDINTKQGDFFLAQLSKVKAIKNVAGKIISFLAQIENFQKKLYLKKKIVLSTEYCITISHVPTKFYEEIGKNTLQIEEWKKLFAIDQKSSQVNAFQPDFQFPLSPEFLTHYNFLVLDTKFFNDNFKDRLLSTFDELDELVSGVLINSENQQALNLIQEKYAQTVSHCYIDPPFNLGENADYLYKVDYKDSTWFTMLYDRIIAGKALLKENASQIVRCNHDGNMLVRMLLDEVFGQQNYRNEIIVRRAEESKGDLNKQFGSMRSITVNYDNLYWYSLNATSRYNSFKKRTSEKQSKAHWHSFWKAEDRPNMRYNLLGLDLNNHYGQWMWSKERAFRAVDNYIKFKEIQEKTGITLEQYWQDNAQSFLDEFGVNMEFIERFGDGWSSIKYWIPPRAEVMADNNWLDIKGYSNSWKFKTENSEILLQRILGTLTNENDIVIDYFDGSGTTTATAHKMKRRWIGIEMGEYFNDVTKKRMIYVLSGESSGISKEVNHQPRGIFKYHVLESYEDTLNNLYLNDKNQLDFSGKAKEEYALQYMLELESREHLFNLQMFRKPFDYQLKVTENNELKPTKVDLVETFNYLIGLYVSKVQRVKDIKVVEGTTRTGVKTLVIWRDLDTTTHDEVEKLLRRFYDSQRTKEFQQIYINGDHHLENLRSEGDSFKIKLIEETFFKKMFNETEL